MSLNKCWKRVYCVPFFGATEKENDAALFDIKIDCLSQVAIFENPFSDPVWDASLHFFFQSEHLSFKEIRQLVKSQIDKFSCRSV